MSSARVTHSALALALTLTVVITGCSSAPLADVEAAPTDPATQSTEPRISSVESEPWEANLGLARTVNLGATFEVGRGEDWGIQIELSDIDAIAEAGFSAIRIPAKWSDWAAADAPYAIDDEFFAMTDAVIDRALANNLFVLLDVHHYVELDADPEGHGERLLAIWHQIAEHHVDRPAQVIFEILNEPNGELSGEVWNDLLARALDTIRQSNPGRTVMVGPGGWYSNLELENLVLPDDDNLIATFHFYEPFRFTHQGASWVQGADEWLGTRWGSDEERALITTEFDAAQAWASQRDVPMFLGEFGVLAAADSDDRVQWMTFVRAAAQERGFSWGYWDWGSGGFGLYDEPAEQWRVDLLDALMG